MTTTKQAQDKLHAQRRAKLSKRGKSYPTEFKGGTAVVVEQRGNLYRTGSGLWWRLVDGVLVCAD